LFRSVIVDACKVANKLDEQQDKYNTLYTTFKEIKDKGIKFDYCPDAQGKYGGLLVVIL
jgi:predicted peroxiredoxin